MKYALASWSFVFGEYSRRPLSIEKAARAASELGYDGLALGGFEPQGSPERYRSGRARREMVNEVRELGLEFVCYAPDLREYDFYDGSKPSASRYREAFSRALDFCSDCGIPLLRVDTVTMTPYPSGFEYERARETTVRTFIHNAEEAAERQIEVVWEYEPGRLFNAPSEILGILREVDRPNFKIQYDTAHGQMCAVVGANQYRGREVWPGGQAGFIRTLSGMIGDVHFADNDNTLRKEGNSNKLSLGDGVIELGAVAAALRQAESAGEWWTVDLGPQAERTVERCASSLRVLRELEFGGGDTGATNRRAR